LFILNKRGLDLNGNVRFHSQKAQSGDRHVMRLPLCSDEAICLHLDNDARQVSIGIGHELARRRGVAWPGSVRTESWAPPLRKSESPEPRSSSMSTSVTVELIPGTPRMKVTV
jgi:hypothetical protein